MGGPWQVRHVGPANSAARVAKVALAALAKVDLQMSTYRDDSDLMRLNRAPVGEWVCVPEELIAVLQCARAVAVQSEGALDVTLGHTVNAWGFGPDPTPANVPTRQDASQSYDLNAESLLVRKNTSFAFDLSALAKGYAVDQAALALEALGVGNFLVEAAGEIVTRGCCEGGSAWKIGLELPVQGVSAPYDSVCVQDCALATSGTYRNLRLIDGREFSHTFDRKTGAPVQSPLLSVTVLHQSCMMADAWATALMVLGPVDGPHCAHKAALAAQFLIRTEGGLTEIRTEAFFEKICA